MIFNKIYQDYIIKSGINILSSTTNCIEIIDLILKLHHDMFLYCRTYFENNLKEIITISFKNFLNIHQNQLELLLIQNVEKKKKKKKKKKTLITLITLLPLLN